MKEQTAVEWLEEQYNLADGYERHLTIEDFIQAKEMESEQLYESYLDGMRDESER
jgi:hypothetical protein